MADLLLLYRACGAECREDYLRELAHDNGLPFDCVRRLADQLVEREDFGELLRLCEEGGSTLQGAVHGFASQSRVWEPMGERAKAKPQIINEFHHVKRG